MDTNLKLKALSRLVRSDTATANQAIQTELIKIGRQLAYETRYDILFDQLKLLEVICFRSSIQSTEIIVNFINSIETRQITYTSANDIFGNEITKFQNAESLIIHAIGVLSNLRYLNTAAVFNELLNLAKHKANKIRSAAEDALKSLASYNIKVIYGDKQQSGIGVNPQEIILKKLEQLEDEELLANFNAISVISDELLSTSMESSSWSYDSLTISKAAVPARLGLADIRHRVIELLKKIYQLLPSLKDKLKLIILINSATRTYMAGGSNDLLKIIENNIKEVLQFYSSLIETEDLQVIQKIEHNSYWIFFHAPTVSVEELALSIEKNISRNAEYGIFKTLIGFEGIHESWMDMKQSKGSPEKIDEKRKAEATKLAGSINSSNYSNWEKRILNYSKVDSDDLATFPIFYEFLEQFGNSSPELAFTFIKENNYAIPRFLIPLLRSLWKGPSRNDIQSLMTSWVNAGQYLYQCAKQFQNNENLDYTLLEKIIEKAVHHKDINVLVVVSTLAVSNYKSEQTKENESLLNRLFIPTLKALSDLQSAVWIFDFWYRRESTQFISELKVDVIELILNNLLWLEEINFHAEEVLYQIAQVYPEKVIDYLGTRLSLDRKKAGKVHERYEAIPYQLYKLNEPLSKLPEKVISTAYGLFHENEHLFQFRGANLVHIIFPEFNDDFENEMIKFLKDGNNSKIRFAVTILRNYEGQIFTHKIVKEIIKSMPVNSDMWNEIAIALESTGVVVGEFGFVEAYERKKSEIESWLIDPDSKVQEFAKWFMNILDASIDNEKARAEEQLLLRKHHFGED